MIIESTTYLYIAGGLTLLKRLLSLFPGTVTVLACGYSKLCPPPDTYLSLQVGIRQEISQCVCLTVLEGARFPFSSTQQYKPSPRSFEPRGRSFFSILSGSRSGINALSALTCARLIPCCERFANGFECCFISSPRFPIVCSRVHCEEQTGGPRRNTSRGRCTSECTHSRTK